MLPLKPIKSPSRWQQAPKDLSLLSVLAGLALMHWQCATKGQISGGPKDETPPAVIWENSTPNLQRHFAERTIRLAMDEWVKLEDPANQILVSPPLQYRADVRVKGRGLVYKFHDDEQLRPNTTYTINFGQAIVDITESNPLDNFTFVFSTGDIIDSLMIYGTVVNAFDRKPLEKQTVMVYEDLADSAVVHDRPLYAARTDKDGQFTIRNMREGTYRVIAINDVNLNYKYDPAAEEIAFLDSFIVLSGQPIEPLMLRSSQLEPSLYLDRLDSSGWNRAVVTFNRTALEVDLSYDDPDQSLIYHKSDRSIQLWYYSTTRDRWRISLTEGGSLIDSLGLNPNRAPGSRPPAMEKTTILRSSTHPTQPVYFCIDRPIAYWDTTLLIMAEGKNETALVQPVYQIAEAHPACLEINYQWLYDSLYPLTLLPGSIADIYGTTLSDTIKEPFPITNPERFGTLELRIGGLSPDIPYLIEVGIRDKSEFTLSTQGQSEFVHVIERVKPATYELRVTEDVNGNGRWDPGNYWLGRQPELTYKSEIETVRANWEVEVSYQWQSDETEK